MDLKFICAQPGVLYYTWQVEVMIGNFIKRGINPNNMEILIGINNNIIPKEWSKLQQHYPHVRFFFYNDTREDKSYIPSIYFNLLKQHLQQYPELEHHPLFLHDSDIVFTKFPNFKVMEYGKAWYLSNTNSYLNYDYIQQKGNYIYEKMCNIVGLDWRIPKLMNSNSGGAQYIVKNTNYEFWNKVEHDSVKLYRWFLEDEPKFRLQYPNTEPIQKWTAGMWALLWNAWLQGHETIVDKRLDFGWVINNYEDVEKYCILHNAGVQTSNSNLFYKGAYVHRLPYNDNLNIDQTKASYFYWQQIQEAKKHTCLL
jgi:hypothetical protein